MKYKNISGKVVSVALPIGTIDAAPGEEVLASPKVMKLLVERGVFELVPTATASHKKRVVKDVSEPDQSQSPE
jgi:hypothetical protein